MIIIEAKKIAEAKLKCIENESSGLIPECNNGNCSDCSLMYEQCNVGEHKEMLKLAISAFDTSMGMEALNVCRIDSYNVFVTIHNDWRYIVNVSEREFKHVIEEAESCANQNHFEIKTEIDLNDFCDCVIYKNYKIYGCVFAYIQYISIAGDDL